MSAGKDDIAHAAARLYWERRERDRRLGGYAVLMGEPAWDLLLRLTVMHGGSALARGEPLNGIGQDLATPVHWLAVLRKLGLAERGSAASSDVGSIRLSRAGLEVMNGVLLGR